MRVKDFDFDGFLKYKEEKDKDFKRFLLNESWEIPVVQMASSVHWQGICRYKEKSLEAQLDTLTEAIRLKTDFMFGYIEPWLGVGLYAAAYGCKYIWHKNDSPQVLPIFNSLDELKHIKHPSIGQCEEMLTVLTMIHY